jgi:hypothetical protein
MTQQRSVMNVLGSRRLFRALILATSISACNNPAASPDYIPQGSLTATILDQAGGPVAGADLRVLSANDSFVWAHGVSGADGLVVFDSGTNPMSPTTTVGLLGATYRAQLTPSAGYLVPSTQSNPATVTIEDKRTTTLTMRLARVP